MGRYLHSDLGHRSQGDVLEVTLTRGANVRLLDSTNLAKYKRGESHRYYGGLAKKSPVHIGIPSTGRWHAVVDMQGLRGSTSARFRVINRSALQPLPLIRDRREDLVQLVTNAAELGPPAHTLQYDIFISHATEDKDTIVRPLAQGLRERGIRVWYDEFELRIGDSLRHKIDSGIASSRFGLVVLSKAFFSKGWAQYELDGLVTMAVGGRQALLPIWHEISKDQVARQSPSLANKVALCTSEHTTDEIADEIAAAIRDLNPVGHQP